jgi:5-methylcytosine-specific restriction protein A
MKEKPERYRLCGEPRCPEIIPAGQTYCSAHGRTNWDRWKRTDPGRSQGYGARWRRVRDRYIREHPACERCGAPAAEVHHRDHRHPSESGANDWSNLESICVRCHRLAEVEHRHQQQQRQR